MNSSKPRVRVQTKLKAVRNFFGTHQHNTLSSGGVRHTWCKLANSFVGTRNMRMANGSQSFRRDSDGPLGRGEGTNETEPFLFPRGTRDDHDHPAEELSVHRIQVLARRCAFPFARRIPRVTKRYVMIVSCAFSCV